MQSTQKDEPEVIRPPAAKRIPKTDTIHGDLRSDDYFWLRDKENPEVARYLEAENAYADAVMKPTEELQEYLYKEMLGRIKQTDMNVPYRKGRHYYYTRTEQGRQYPIHCRKSGNMDAAEQVTLDLNELAAGRQFMALGAYAVSDDGNLLAYSTDNSGFRQYTMAVKNLLTGQLLPDRAEKVGSVAWAADNRTLFYTVEDSAKRQYRLYRHVLGSDSHDLIYEEQDQAFSIAVTRTRSQKYLILGIGSLSTSEARCLRADTPMEEWKIIAPRRQDEEYDVEHHGDRFYIRVNDTGRNFRLVAAPVDAPARENWTEILAHRPEVMLEGMDFFSDFYVLVERENALPHLRVTQLSAGLSHRIRLPEAVYSISPGTNADFDTRFYRYHYQSLVTPLSIFDYDTGKRSSELMKQTEVLAGYDPAGYSSERLYASARDGTQIPISLVYRRGLPRNGQAPLYLYGYGAYGYPLPIAFSSNRVSLLDRGFVCAYAHVRGGGDLGKPWHDGGRMMKKKNTFSDFIDAAEFLMAQHYTSPGRLIIEGGSAGGLLIGAVCNMRPELFRAAISKVPFVDVVNTMLDETLPLTIGEYEEWGNPRKKEEYDYLKTYCPYTNLRAMAYPAMLVKTSFNDSQVMYWEPAKYVARLRTLKTDSNLLLLKTNMAAGHGGASGRYDALKETALDYAFILSQAGLSG